MLGSYLSDMSPERCKGGLPVQGKARVLRRNEFKRGGKRLDPRGAQSMWGEKLERKKENCRHLPLLRSPGGSNNEGGQS